MNTSLFTNLIQFFCILIICVFTSSCEKADDNTYITNNYLMSDNGVLKIGDLHAGGWIFYLDATGEHGLVCATRDITDTIPTILIGSSSHPSTGVLIGTGEANTTTLAAWYGPGNYAAYVCDTLTLDGYSDWFVPSADEMNAMAFNLHNRSQGNFFSPAAYATSSVTSNGTCYQMQTGNGDPEYIMAFPVSPFQKIRLRPVRSF